MPEGLFEPIPITYTGLYADAHLVDAQQLGKSLIGISKIANSLCHFYFFEQTTHDPRLYEIRFFAGPARANGQIQEIFAIMNSGVLPLFQPFVIAGAKIFIELATKYLIKRISGQKSEATVAIEKMAEVAVQAQKAQMQNTRWLQKTMEKLLNVNRHSLREVPEPVGKSVRKMSVGIKDDATEIDEPTAEVLRAKDQMEVGEMGEYVVTMEGVFKTNGACKVKLDNGVIVAGKITDPVLDQPGNIYTHALDRAEPLLVTAKPTMKDGEINRLFISNARRERR